jgi:hypothetical protein
MKAITAITAQQMDMIALIYECNNWKRATDTRSKSTTITLQKYEVVDTVDLMRLLLRLNDISLFSIVTITENQFKITYLI